MFALSKPHSFNHTHLKYKFIRIFFLQPRTSMSEGRRTTTGQFVEVGDFPHSDVG